MDFQADSFQPMGCDITIPGNSVTVGAGTQMIRIYEYLDAFNQTMVGGMGKTVGIGGYVTGGGHSVLSNRYGLAADQVLQMEMVTPGGDIITINECSHPDLFWAMRGVSRPTLFRGSSVSTNATQGRRIHIWRFDFGDYEDIPQS
jgi:FAD/FMN-containing dehydrogenase